MKILLFALAVLTSTSLFAITHGSIIKKNVPLNVEIDRANNPGVFPANATVDYKIVTTGGKLWAKVVGAGYTLHFQPWSSQIRLFSPTIYELTKYNAPNNVNVTVTNNIPTTIVTEFTYANPAFNQIQIVQSQMDVYNGTTIENYNVDAPNSGLTGDSEKPILTKVNIGTQVGTTIPISCTATDDSGDYFYIVTDVANNFSYVSFTDDFTVTGLTEGITYTLSVLAVDFSGNQSIGLTTAQTIYKADDAMGGISLSQNPFSKGTLSIKLPEGATQLSIFDITGKAVYQKQVTKNEYLINQSVFKSKGVYVVNVVTTKNSMNKKVIVIK